MTTNGSDRPEGSRAQHGNATGGGNKPAPQIDADIAQLSRSMLSRLSRTIESEVIPRFMLAFEFDGQERTGGRVDDLSAKIGEFVELVIQHDAAVAAEYVTALRSQGARLADIYIDLLGPAARRLGEMWETDDVTFAEVAIGVCRMHQVLLEFSRCFDPAESAGETGRSALIVPTPGEEHTFGLFVVVEFLRRSGWHCWTGSPRTRDELRTLVRSQHFDAIGLSLSAERNAAPAADAIADVRKHSKNPNVAILLGGNAANRNPELVKQLGADRTATDGREAVRVLNELYGVNGGAAARD